MNPIPLLGYDIPADADDLRTARGIGNGLALGVLIWLVIGGVVLWVQHGWSG